MTPRELILLSPYRLPTQNAVLLGDEDVAAFLQAYSALWHPAALAGAESPPKIASPYDHDQPTAGHVYALPVTPPHFLPEGWRQRVRQAGAASFTATADRGETLANLLTSLRPPAGEAGPAAALLDLDPAAAAPFFALGFGYLIVDVLFEAMQHDKLLDTSGFWQDIRSAVDAVTGPDPEAVRQHLRSAAERLLAAREVLYPVTIHVVDLCLLDAAHLDRPLPAAAAAGQPLNVLASANLLESYAGADAGRWDDFRRRVREEQIEVVGGPFLEREDALLPVESQRWNLHRGREVYQTLLESEVRVFARRRFAAHPHLPLLLNDAGINRAILLTFDDAAVPTHRATVVNWPSPDGKQVEAFARKPHDADSPQTYFNLAHTLHESIMQDHAATLALLHRDKPAPPWYADWIELTRIAPVLGHWTTLSRYFNEVLAGEYATAASPDDFHFDYLSERVNAGMPTPVSGFANHQRWRRRIDTAWTLAGLAQSLGAADDDVMGRLTRLEGQVESLAGTVAGRSVDEAQRPAVDVALREEVQKTAERLAGRLLARASAGGPGHLLLNPCGFARRVALELPGVASPIPMGGPVKASQLDGDLARLVVEVPALGFTWFPQSGPPGATAPSAKLKLADERAVRNEFFEAEIDPTTGGLRSLRDPRTRHGRVGQQLIYQPGSVMRAKQVRVTSNGPALGEVTSEGALLNDRDEVLATFRQRFRAWLGRPLLELRIELYPVTKPEGYPWHAYYGARFAWRDERATLVRGVNGLGNVTTHTRPVTPDYLELREGRLSTALLLGGLPFLQRHGARMVDVILVPPGETATVFDLALGLDREQPAQTALGLVTPAPLVPTPQGPPHVGATGWLFHLDAPNLLLHSLRPGADGTVTARMQEIANHATQAELRCVRDPVRAELVDGQGHKLLDAGLQGDAAVFEALAGDLTFLRVAFGPS